MNITIVRLHTNPSLTDLYETGGTVILGVLDTRAAGKVKAFATKQIQKIGDDDGRDMEYRLIKDGDEWLVEQRVYLYSGPTEWTEWRDSGMYVSIETHKVTSCK